MRRQGRFEKINPVIAKRMRCALSEEGFRQIMKIGLKKSVSTLAILSLFLLASGAGLHAAPSREPSDEETRKIASAVPNKAQAIPAKPRKLLVFTLCKGYYHTSIPCGAKAVELMGEKTGAFKATTSDAIPCSNRRH